LAGVVAAIGVYGVVAFGVHQRAHEIGVRIAVGARRADILRLVVGDSARFLVFGIATGLVLCLLLGRLVESLLYGLSAHSPAVLVGSSVALVLLGIFASLLPALRASRVDPSFALRAE
jgi:ABC-type antimicrobial peptide transport system permease subunit